MPHWLGAKRSAAHWAAYTAREGSVDPVRSVQIGMRGHPSSLIHGGKVGSSSEALGYRVVPMAEFEELGIEKSIALIRERVGDGPAYITFDLDCLDPSVAPGVSNLEPGFGGFSIREATRLFARLARARHHRGRCGLPDAHQGQPEPDHGAGGHGDDVRTGEPDCQPACRAEKSLILLGLAEG